MGFQGEFSSLLYQLYFTCTISSADLLSKYTTQAGYIIRGLHLFANINNVFDHGLRAQGYDMAAANIVLEDDEDDDEPGTPADPLEDDRYAYMRFFFMC